MTLPVEKRDPMSTLISKSGLTYVARTANSTGSRCFHGCGNRGRDDHKIGGDGDARRVRRGRKGYSVSTQDKIFEVQKEGEEDNQEAQPP